MRGFIALFWRLRAWTYRRQIAAQNRHGAAVNRRIEVLKIKARDADRRARAVMGATGTGGA
jgi:hypothetical protein